MNVGVQRFMDFKPFSPPVLVRFGKIGLIHSVITVNEAAKLLRDARWPVKRRLNLDARIACIDALAGADTCHDVRAKFVEAAREAGVLLGDG